MSHPRSPAPSKLLVVLGIVLAFGVAMLLGFWFIWTFADSEGFETYYTLAVMAFIVVKLATHYRSKSREAQGADADVPAKPTRPEDPPGTSKAPAPASAVPSEVLEEWDHPLPIERSQTPGTGTAQPGGDLFIEGFTPDAPVPPRNRAP